MSRRGLPTWFVAYRERGHDKARGAFSAEEARHIAARRNGQVYRRINLRPTGPGRPWTWDEVPLPLTLERGS